MNTRILATLAAASGLVSAASMNAQELAYSVSYGIESEYVFRGVEIASESLQGSIEATYGDGYIGVWANEALDDFGSNASEFDFYAGWGYALNDAVTLDFGGTLYHYPDFKGDDTFEAYVGAAFDTALAPSLYVYHDFDLDAFTFEGSIGHSVDVTEVSRVDLGLTAGYVDFDNAGHYAYYGATADYVYTLSDNTDVAVGVRYSTNDKDLGFSPDGNLWGGLSFSHSF
ncbi:hypothetical protein IEN85_10400 [Pelagicoccus sp. NFK12]|uniref:TIGR02001 family outer membrane protein n=1 Tax=Pelagicoccus enzymogenes TaxID=2773457 RepID=A0A927FAI3_9BACT|nr:TorF family putative porin [Pelagicoccus enzymogenes]MBD5779898.1 hypothetical protein [Pelagicoccus enzymogenes]MDQ8200764.1 TorF family putative porin [Pelagicoccus enzymogenes]